MISRSVKQNRKSKIIGIVICIAIVTFLVFAVAPYFLGSIFQKNTQTILMLDDSIGTVLDSTASKKTLLAKIESLETNRAYSELLSQEVEILRNENQALKESMGRVQNQARIISGILMTHSQSLYNVVLIDAGERNGIQVGSQVFALGNVLVGFIDTVFNTTATVRLISYPGQVTNLVHQKTGTIIEATGQGGVGFKFTLPRDIIIEVGDTIIATGVQTYIVGVVEEVINDPREPVQTILARLSANPETLRFLEINTNL